MPVVRVPTRLVRYGIHAAHALSTAVMSYQPNVDAKLQAAADRAYVRLHNLINYLHEYEEAHIDGATEEENRAYSQAQEV